MKNQNQIQQFHDDEFGDLDVLMIDGKPYFPATECAKVLGYKNPRDAIAKHCRADGVAKRDGVTLTTNQHGATTQQIVEKSYISEGNLYRLIIRSKLPTAVRFEVWVCDEILPSVRKHGAYVTYDTLDELLRSPKFAEDLIKRLDEERQRGDVLEELATEMTPKAIYCDLVLQCGNAIPISLIAKDYGMSAASFNSLLHDLGVQYKIGGTWLLYQEFANKGYTKTLTYRFSEDISVMHTCWTQKGRLFLFKFLEEIGILPLAEPCVDQLSA